MLHFIEKPKRVPKCLFRNMTLVREVSVSPKYSRVSFAYIYIYIYYLYIYIQT